MKGQLDEIWDTIDDKIASTHRWISLICKS